MALDYGEKEDLEKAAERIRQLRAKYAVVKKQEEEETPVTGGGWKPCRSCQKRFNCPKKEISNHWCA